MMITVGTEGPTNTRVKTSKGWTGDKTGKKCRDAQFDPTDSKGCRAVKRLLFECVSECPGLVVTSHRD